ncbi:hypothetical protein NSA56_01755 [Oceanobacillus caeni]|uniref:hypothetical protein n=1 Tax=Oceanobacillus caeni TaxID=405946 RepID=UPI00214A05D6|nr:hypothetical protein [Oceanobacillus caeni]MCR1833121.1 hypothetical protein [Oceanobacillus caeni]
MNQQEMQMMTEAYYQLIQIEMQLRSVIKEKMTEKYGIHWHAILSKRIENATIRKKFDDLEYYQVVSYFNILPSLTSIYPTKLKLQLRSLGDIRNKIAHHKMLNKEEFKRLDEVYRELCVPVEEKSLV